MMRKELPRVTPESVGLSSRKLLEMVKKLEKAGSEMHGIMLTRHGKLVLEGWWAPYTRETVHIDHSFGKSYVGTAVGAACTEGLLSVEDPVIRFFPEEIERWKPDVTGNLGRIRVRDMLTMTNGMKRMCQAGEDLVKNYLTEPVQNEPGTVFLYNTSGSCMLGEIVRRVSGMSVLDYVRSRVLEPIGCDMEHFCWMTFRNGLHAAPGVASCTEDNLRLGMLYLQDGSWDGRQLISADWIREATKKQSDNGQDGYGYQLWLYRQPGSFRFAGGHGQDCFMSRPQDIALAINQAASEPHDPEANFDILDEYLFAAGLPERLPEDPEGYAALLSYMAGLEIPRGAAAPVHGCLDGWAGEYVRVSGNFHLEPELCPGIDLNVNRDFYTLDRESTDSIRIENCREGLRFTLNDDLSFTARTDGRWVPEEAQSAMPAYHLSCANLVAEKDTLIVTQWFFQTCFKTQLKITRNGERLSFLVRKERLHDDEPYLFREAEFVRR